MAIAVNDTIRASVVWQAGLASQQVNVHHLLVEARAVSDTDFYADIAEWFVEAYTPVLTHMSVVIDHDRIELFNVSDNTPEPWIARVAALDGSNGGESLPAQVSAEVYFRTSISRHIGRTFLPTFCEGDNLSGAIAATTLTDLATFGANVVAGSALTNGSDLRKVIWDRSAGIGRSITSYVVPVLFRTQRRRRVGVGA